MNGSRVKWRLVLVFCLTVLGAVGCAEVQLVDLGACWELPWNEKPDQVPGVISPAQRIERLQQAARDAPKTTAVDQQQISGKLAEVLHTEADPMIRAEIVRTLGEFSAPAAAPALHAALEDSDPVVRIAACKALGRRGGPEAVGALAAVISGDVNADVRLAAARALGQTGNPDALGGLGLALDDPDPALQRRAVLSLRKITGEDLGNDVNKWRQYVKGELPRSSRPTSIAERIRRMF